MRETRSKLEKLIEFLEALQPSYRIILRRYRTKSKYNQGLAGSTEGKRAGLGKKKMLTGRNADQFK